MRLQSAGAKRPKAPPPLRAFYWTTLGNAVALGGLEDKIGTLDEGTEADIVVLNSHATPPAMALRMETCQTLSEELFILQIMADDRAVSQTYVAGEAMKA